MTDLKEQWPADEEKGECGLNLHGTSSPCHGPALPTPPITPVSPQTATHVSTTSKSSLLATVSRLSRLLSAFRRRLLPSRSGNCLSPLREPYIRQIHSMPHGYPKLAAFLDSDENFMVYRRFGYVQSRLLLEKQDDLRRLEEELERMDRHTSKTHAESLMSRHDYHESCMQDRVQLLARLEATFNEYAALVTSAKELTATNKPATSEYNSVRNWLHIVDPVYDEDAAFILHKDDLITLRPGREHAWLDAALERALRFTHCRLINNLFRSPDTRRKTDGTGHEVFYTHSRIDALVNVIITFMVLILLVLPIYLLYRLEVNIESPRTAASCIAVLLVATLAFSACVCLFTKARRHEILAASAAYCAVLVVFFSNITPGGNNGVH